MKFFCFNYLVEELNAFQIKCGQKYPFLFMVRTLDSFCTVDTL